MRHVILVAAFFLVVGEARADPMKRLTDRSIHNLVMAAKLVGGCTKAGDAGSRQMAQCIEKGARGAPPELRLFAAALGKADANCARAGQRCIKRQVDRFLTVYADGQVLRIRGAITESRFSACARAAAAVMGDDQRPFARCVGLPG